MIMGCRRADGASGQRLTPLLLARNVRAVTARAPRSESGPRPTRRGLEVARVSPPGPMAVRQARAGGPSPAEGTSPSAPSGSYVGAKRAPQEGRRQPSPGARAASRIQWPLPRRTPVLGVVRRRLAHTRAVSELRLDPHGAEESPLVPERRALPRRSAARRPKAHSWSPPAHAAKHSPPTVPVTVISNPAAAAAATP
jgi:hypothetical protein